MLKNWIMFNNLSKCSSIRSKLKEWVKKMCTSLNLYYLMVKGVLCTPRKTLKLIIVSWNNQLTCIVLEINNYNAMIEEKNCISTKTSIILIKWITDKNAIIAVFFKDGFYYFDNSTKLFIFVRCSLLM